MQKEGIPVEVPKGQNESPVFIPDLVFSTTCARATSTFENSRNVE
jgi:hypothetical protein